MAGPITTGSFAKDLQPVVFDWYGLKYDEHPQVHKEIFEVLQSTHAFEEVMGASTLGLAQVMPEGSGVQYDTMSQAFKTTFRHVVYALGFIVTMQAIKNGEGVVKGLLGAEQLAMSLRTTKEIVHANILNRAFNSNYAYGDGKEACATDHPNKKGGTWRNALSTAADLSEASLEQADIDIADFRDDAGKRINYHPIKLIIPKELKFDSARILQSMLQSDTTSNNTNALKYFGTIEDTAIVPELTDTDAWFLKTNCPRGLISFNREDDSFDSDNDFDTKNAKFMGMMWFSCGIGDPRGLFGSPGA